MTSIGFFPSSQSQYSVNNAIVVLLSTKLMRPWSTSSLISESEAAFSDSENLSAVALNSPI